MHAVFDKGALTATCICLSLQGVRRKNFKAVRSVVEKQLFAARPTFAGALRQIQAAVAELRSVSFTHANPNHTYTLQEYGELQAVTREQKAKPALDGVVDRIQKVRPCVAADMLGHCSSVLGANACTWQHRIMQVTSLQNQAYTALDTTRRVACVKQSSCVSVLAPGPGAAL